MQQVQTNLLARDDTFFGVCEALGEDFRFNAQYLRVAFAVAIFFSPLWAIAVYAGLGLLVGATRLIAPNPRTGAVEPEQAAAAGEIVGAVMIEAEEEQEEPARVPLAA